MTMQKLKFEKEKFKEEFIKRQEKTILNFGL
jgi:hypothetical protein